MPNTTDNVIIGLIYRNDNVFTNNHQDNQKQERGVVYAELSDHFLIYNINKISM